MQYVAYLFELKSIQSYLMTGGKLKDMVSASDMLVQLTEDSLEKTMEVVGLSVTHGDKNESSINFARRAGGAIYILAQENQQNKLEQFRLLWTLTVQQVLPDCEFVDCLTKTNHDISECIEKGMAQLQQQRSLIYPSLPLSTPLTQVAPRTGTAAVAKIDKEWLDKAGRQKRQYKQAKSNLVNKFCQDDSFQWPTSLEEEDFPYSKGEKYVAIIHIDGNALGKLLIQITELIKSQPHQYIKVFSTFSEQLKQTTEKAAEIATEKVLLKECRERKLEQQTESEARLVAARPLILGGDDLTLIIRADLAIAFCESFIQVFEENSSEIKKAITKILNSADSDSKKIIQQLPEYLTACAGIAFLKPSQPFMMGYQLAESLCKHAKDISKNISLQQSPSSLCFYQIQSSLTDNYKQLISHELTTPNAEQLTLEAYAVEKDGKLSAKKTAIDKHLPCLSDLRKLSVLLQQEHNASIGSKLRQWASLLMIDQNAADDFYQQMENNISKQGLKKTYAELRQYNNKLLCQELTKLTWFNNNRSHIVDLITLINIGDPCDVVKD